MFWFRTFHTFIGLFSFNGNKRTNKTTQKDSRYHLTTGEFFHFRILYANSHRSHCQYQLFNYRHYNMLDTVHVFKDTLRPSRPLVKHLVVVGGYDGGTLHIFRKLLQCTCQTQRGARRGSTPRGCSTPTVHWWISTGPWCLHTWVSGHLLCR